MPDFLLKTGVALLQLLDFLGKLVLLKIQLAESFASVFDCGLLLFSYPLFKVGKLVAVDRLLKAVLFRQTPIYFLYASVQ